MICKRKLKIMIADEMVDDVWDEMMRAAELEIFKIELKDNK